MGPTSQDVKDLIDGTNGLVFGTNLFVSEMPDQPDLCVGIFDSGGFDPEANFELEKPTFQVLVRGEAGGYLATYALAEAIRVALHGDARLEVTVNGTRYLAFWQIGGVNYLGADEDSLRPQLSLNFRTQRATA